MGGMRAKWVQCEMNGPCEWWKWIQEREREIENVIKLDIGTV